MPNYEEYAQKFQNDGYLVAEGLFDPDAEVQPFKDAYEKLIDALAHIYLAEANPAALENYDQLPFPERFAILLGSSGGAALHHLDPVLNIFVPNFRWRDDLPSAQIPALFDVIRHQKILDVLESLIGSEIFASPIYHINLKLARQHLDVVKTVAEAVGRDNPELETFYNFQVGHTNWHMDAISGLPDSHESQIVNVWIPITDARVENGCLMVIPGSHQLGVQGAPFPEELTQKGIPLEVSAGNVVFLANKVLHSSTPNTSDADYRWAFNFRYVPTGQPTGRPFLPGFIARSRTAPHTELKNPYVWATMWERSLTYLMKNGVPYDYSGLYTGELRLEDAQRITQHWNRLAPDVHGWLRLGG